MMRRLFGDTGGRPVWRTETGLPAIVSVAIRDADVFAEAEYEIVAEPVPLAVTVIHDAELLAVHVHPVVVVRLIVPVATVDPTLNDVGVTV
jgi:hypothetical protein